MTVLNVHLCSLVRCSRLRALYIAVGQLVPVVRRGLDSTEVERERRGGIVTGHDLAASRPFAIRCKANRFHTVHSYWAHAVILYVQKVFSIFI